MKKEILYKNLEQYLRRQYKRRIPMLSGTILEPIQRVGPDINMKSLEALLKRRGESFSECLLQMIDKSGSEANRADFTWMYIWHDANLTICKCLIVA